MTLRIRQLKEMIKEKRSMQYLQHSAKDLDFPTVILRFFDDLGLVSHASPSEESKYPYEQCCGSGMFIPDPDFYPSWITDPKTATNLTLFLKAFF